MKNVMAQAVSFLLLTATAEASPQTLFDALNEQFSYMQAVAAWKRDTGSPVEYSGRQARLYTQRQLVNDANAAADNGLHYERAHDFFEARYAATNEIQYCLITQWTEDESAPVQYKDINEVVLPALTGLRTTIIESLAEETITSEHEKAFKETIQVDCLSEETKDKLFNTLLKLK
ncbi:hypothetical protein [Roseibium sp. RKSG952]|uniref:hypothetical protein n=1 Tax=Roseibium sp. RKSG952 TaxID=2529384 RepID=UPI0012BB810A|nr:hypothetical protein [Roseibium sp. RKSG952]MTH96873.1 hypothetical protein [Roseibium sp. RKSG952]